jgi:hypothetical protein
MKPAPQVKSQPPLNGNGHQPQLDREAWRVEHERRRAELRRIYAGVPDLMVDDLERQAMTETDALARSGALALVVYVRRRRRKAQEQARVQA